MFLTTENIRVIQSCIANKLNCVIKWAHDEKSEKSIPFEIKRSPIYLIGIHLSLT